MKIKLTEAEKYRADVFAYIDRLLDGRYEITKLCVPENTEKFKKVVEEYIKRGTYNGYDTELTETEIIKKDVMLPLQTKKYHENMSKL